MRSRAIWLKEGDDNTKFYHKFSNGHKAINIIWQLADEQGELVNTFPHLVATATTHFRNIYKSPPNATLAKIMRISQLFPRIFEQEEGLELTKEVSLGELEDTLKWFKRDKIHGPDGWNVEFYLAFFDTLGEDLLQVIEEFRSFGRMYEAYNSTFIILIPKSENPTSFNDFRPISSCSYIYKIISKILANHLWLILSNYISTEQFSFLQNKQIHESVGTTQEILHYIQTQKLKGMVLKVYLSKAFDRVNWLFIRMILTHLGFPYEFIKWIMCCITNVTFSVLVNDAAFPFFHFERGLRKGFPLSLLLLLLIMEGLSHIIKEEHGRGRLRGICITE